MRKETDTQIAFNIDPKLKEKFKKYCEKEGRSMSAQLLYWIRKYAETEEEK